MKIIILFFIFFHCSLRADDNYLAQARDHYLERSSGLIKKYCAKRNPTLSTNESYIYICRLQMKADCLHGKEEIRKNACLVVKKTENLERMVLISDKDVNLDEDIPLGRQTKNRFSDFVFKFRNNETIVTNDNEATEENEGDDLRNAKEELMSYPRNLACKEDKDCTIAYYGPKNSGCDEGHEGFLPLSKSGDSVGVINAIVKYNTAYTKYYSKKENFIFCATVIRKIAPHCEESVCKVRRDY